MRVRGDGGEGWLMPEPAADAEASASTFKFDAHGTGESELQRRRAVAYHISGHAHCAPPGAPRRPPPTPITHTPLVLRQCQLAPPP